MIKIPEKKQKKGISNGIRQGGRQPDEEPERSDGNPPHSEQSHFLRLQKIPGKKKKPDWQIYLLKSGLLFAGIDHDSWKKDKKNGISNGIRQGGRQPDEEPERSDGNPPHSEQSHFFAAAKKYQAKRKSLTGKFIC